MTRVSYDAVASAYDAAMGEELAAKPVDRALLAVLHEVCPSGPILDVGCGPGHVGAYVAERGRTVAGIDLSPAMCMIASRRRIPSVVASMRQLPVRSGAAAGVLCLYAVIHLHAAEREDFYQELQRVLCREGCGLIAFHVSDGGHRPGTTNHLREWLDQPVDLAFHFLDPDREAALVARSGLRLFSRTDRVPGPGEHPSQRTYFLVDKRAT